MSENEGQGGGEFTPAPIESDPVQMKIDELQADPAYLNDADPRHKIVNQKVKQLFAQKYPEDQEGEGEGHPQPTQDRSQAGQETVPSPIEGVTLPPLVDDEWDTETLQSFAPIAKEMGLSTEEIQSELEVFAAGGNRLETAYDEDSCIEYLNNSWGASAAGIVRQAQKFIDALPDNTRARLEGWLEETGLGNHPRIIEAFARRQAVKGGFSGE